MKEVKVNERILQSRINKAYEIAMADLRNGRTLDKELEWCVKNEWFAGAEGIKRAINDFKNKTA